MSGSASRRWGRGDSFPERALLSYRRRLGTKTDAVESGTGDRMGTIRADFKAHRNHRRDALGLLPVLRELLLEMLQEVDLVSVDTPRLTAPQGNVLHMRVPALQADICWTVLRRNAGVPSAHGLRLTPKKGQTARHRRDEAWGRHFRTKRYEHDERTIGTIIDIQCGSLGKALDTPDEF